MPEEIKVVDYYYVQVPDKPGAAAQILQAFKEAGVNLLAFSGFPEGRRAQLDSSPRIRPRFAPPRRSWGSLSVPGNRYS